MKNIPKKYLFSNGRKEMWENTKPIITHLDKALDFSRVYAIGSMVSKKRHPGDVDFAVITQVKSKKSNLAYPVDLIILPESADLKEYITFFEKFMKRKYGRSSRQIRLK